jgi:hypothetical protein
MSSPLHQKQLPNDGIHAPFGWKFSSASNRVSFIPAEGTPTLSSNLTSDDLYRLALQTDENSVWLLTAISPVTWAPFVVLGADAAATYLVLNTTSSLTNERTLSISGSSGLKAIDAGPNGTFSLSIDNNVVATLSGSVFTGVVSASAGLSGSLQRVGPGLSYLVGAGNVTITSQSNGQIVISGSGGSSGGNTGGDSNASYLTLNATASLPNERVFSVSGTSGLKIVDNGAASTLALSINDNVVATLSGSVFTGVVSASAGLSGSLQRVGPNLSYLVAGANVTVTSQSNGQIVIGSTATGGSGADVSGSYVTIGNTGSLPNERALATSAGLTLTDGGAGSSVTLGIDNNVVATLSGSTFAKLSGSLQQTAAGLSYLVGVGSVTITSQSNGQIIISGSGGGTSGGGSGDSGASYLTLNATASLSNERVFSISGTSGLKATDAGPNGTFTLSINDNVVATLSGSVFTGVVSASAGLSGSLQQVGPGLSYLVAGTNVTIVSQSNGQLVVSSTATGGTGGADVSGSYVTIGNTGSLPNERALTAGTGLTLVDAGAGSSVTLGINNNVVATLSGSVFTGVISASAGISGSLQRVGPNLSYLVAGTNVTIVSQSNGQIIVGAIAGGTGGADVSASYVTIGNTGSLPNERSLTAGTGVLITDGGANANVTLGIDNNVVATLSGSVFTGVVSASAGLSGSLQQVGPGLSYLIAGANMIVTSQSNGQIIISSTATGGGGGADVSGSYVTIGNTGSLPNERALTAGTGLLLTDGGAGSSVTLGINNNVVATVSGTRYTGVLAVDPSGIASIGTDVAFFVSGTKGGPATTRKVSLNTGDMFVSGTIISAVTSTIVAGIYTIQPTDIFIHLSQSVNNITASLPNPSLGGQYVFKDIVGSGSSFPALIKRFGSERIDNIASDYVAQSNYGSSLFWSDGQNWWKSGGL